MNRWFILGIAYGLAALFVGFYLNSRIHLLYWIFDGAWWHTPTAIVLLLTFIVSWSRIMTEGTMENIYGREKLREIRSRRK